MYQQAEGETELYADIASQDDIWALIKPEKWKFDSGGHEFKSRVVIDFSWPNPHYLVAYLADTELYQLDVEG